MLVMQFGVTLQAATITSHAMEIALRDPSDLPAPQLTHQQNAGMDRGVLVKVDAARVHGTVALLVGYESANATSCNVADVR